MTPKRLSILGVGLLGGSVGLAAKSRINGCEVVGYDTDSQAIADAQRCGAIDWGTSEDLTTAIDGADLILLAAPIRGVRSLLQQLASIAPPGVTLTDVASTKRSIVADAQKLFPDGRFVGSHPIAGGEQKGVGHARGDLLSGMLCIVTPAPAADTVRVSGVEGFWQSLGMRTQQMSPGEHDRLLALASHLPHVLAAALVKTQDERSQEIAGRGFLDATRIAGGDPWLWRDILLDNRDEVRAAIAGLRGQLDDLDGALERGDEPAVVRFLEGAANRRRALAPSGRGRANVNEPS